MKDRIIEVRKLLGLSQKEFGFNLGCSRDKISNIELQRAVIDDIFLTHVCAIYHVNKQWLETGTGEIWEDESDDTSSIIVKYDNLPPISKALVSCLLDMSEIERFAVESFVKRVASTINSQSKNK